MKRASVGRLSGPARLFLWLLPPLTALLALSVGRIQVPLIEVLRSIAAHLGAGFAMDANTEQVLWSMRLPRILLALLTGAGLAVSGCAFQSLFSNPLATPDTLGVASGASFGAAVAILWGLNIFGIQALALLFGVAALALSWLAGFGRGRGMNTIILAGIMIGSLFNALVSLVKFLADTESQLPAITYWLMGSLNAASYQTLALGAPLIVAGLIVLYLLRWRLNVLPLPEDEAKTSGVSLTALRAVTILSATAMTAACVSMCGQVGWVGLLVPHICRMRFGSNHLSLVPASISIGASFMVVVDTLARSLTAASIPISVLTAIIGAPFFILLLRRFGGWEL